MEKRIAEIRQLTNDICLGCTNRKKCGSPLIHNHCPYSIIKELLDITCNLFKKIGSLRKYEEMGDKQSQKKNQTS